MSPATVRYPLRDIKLLSVNDKEKCCSYWMYPFINSGMVRLDSMAEKFRPDLGKHSRFYHQVRRHCESLAKLGYVRLIYPEKVDWQKTIKMREEDVTNSVKEIFAAAIRKDTPPIGSTGTLSGKPDLQISTVKVHEHALHVVPTEKLFALINRMQNSNQFLKGANSRREMQEIREKAGVNYAKLKIQRKSRKPCPYFVSVRTKRERMDAIFRLRGIRRHSMFKRRDKREVNEELRRALEPVQTNFEKYLETIEDLQITLQNKESGEIKFIDYQTRFTDPDRQSGTIARYHDVWRKAGQGNNTGVLLTLTSYPPSEAPKHQHRESLWHTDRHFGPAWNTFISKLTKRNRAIRRDELLDLKRDEIKKIRPVTVKPERCWHCGGTGKIEGVTKATRIRTCPRCKGKGHLMRIALTKPERSEALLPMSKKYLCDQKLVEILKTEPDRIELTDEEIAEASAPVNFRPRYLQVYEFQKNGLLHSHTAIFGKSYLAYWEDIALDWMKTGQGERINVYGIQMQGNRWVWLKDQPADARNRQPVDYLGKYLAKGVKARGGHGLYWSINKRFFTNSRALTEARELPDQTEKISTYEYLGTSRNNEIPAWLQSIQTGRKRAWAGGSFDGLGWGAGDPGGGALA